ncbi:MAG TPA: hypothetical protein VF462_06350 [Micromonosporaceae bacterium]
MTKKITISLPDDLAERLEREPNVSAFVAQSLRRQMAGETTREILQRLGFKITDEGLARAGERLERAQAGITPELLEKAARLREDILAARLRANP